MITKIEGIIKPDGGEGHAHQKYVVMIREIAKHFADVKNCGKHGTINVISLTPPLCKSFADYWTPRIRCEPIAGNLGVVRHEKYGLIQISFECPPGGQHSAWIIMPEGHGYSYSENEGVEIIAEPFIPTVRRGASCAIYIDHKPQIPRPNDFGELRIEIVPIDMRRLKENPAAVLR
jgi:hypothetical protein